MGVAAGGLPLHQRGGAVAAVLESVQPVTCPPPHPIPKEPATPRPDARKAAGSRHIPAPVTHAAVLGGRSRAAAAAAAAAAERAKRSERSNGQRAVKGGFVRREGGGGGGTTQPLKYDALICEAKSSGTLTLARRSTVSASLQSAEKPPPVRRKRIAACTIACARCTVAFLRDFRSKEGEGRLSGTEVRY